MKFEVSKRMQLRQVLIGCTVICGSLSFAMATALGVVSFAASETPKPTELSTTVEAEKVENKNSADVGNDEGDLQQEQVQQVVGDFLSRGYPDPREALTNEKQAFQTPFGQVIWPEIADKMYVKDKAYYVDYRGHKLKLTLDPELQGLLARELERQRKISATVVIIESNTGRILAMVERRGENNDPLLLDKSALVSARAPAASLMKIVTATSGIEKGGLDPDDEIFFHGGCGKLRHQNWLRNPRTDRQHLTFARAFGLSCNTVFARIALYWTGLASIKEYADRYYFNRPIPSDLRFETSAALIPRLEEATALEVGEFGAGFGASKLSPIHSALMAAAAANEGMMMAPFLVDSATDSAGKQVYTGTPREVSRVFKKETADKMLQLMHATITSGTSRRYFARRGTRKERFEIGGKTGTLSDAEERSTLYTWFNGVTQVDIPSNVAVSALVASPQTWVVRASSLAQVSIAHFLKLQRRISGLKTTSERNF